MFKLGDRLTRTKDFFGMAGGARTLLFGVKGFVTMNSVLAAFLGYPGVAAAPVAILNAKILVKNNQEIRNVLEKVLDRMILPAQFFYFIVHFAPPLFVETQATVARMPRERWAGNERAGFWTVIFV